ncbi:MAG TPA: PQQ-binding-like beta-propeller repeat protein [Solirubrobacteraceae bacterium]|nr:PQQ-binding-like beta-propeller repeat protein [Solirubrobacteraceae bacterium]
MAGPSVSKRSRWILAAVLAVLLLLAGLALAGYLYERHRTGDIYHPHARFIPQPTPRLPTGAERFAWPFYGYTKNHTRHFPASGKVFPPFRTVWSHNGGSLLEFPPTIQSGRIFQLADDGTLTARNKTTGHLLWRRRVGSLSASTPAAVGDAVYATVLARADGVRKGAVFALDAATGRVLWSRMLPSPSESSPLVDSRRLFFGSQNGTLYALDIQDGAVAWTYHAAGSIKASPSLANGILYFGDYSGHLQALSEATGHRIWDSTSEGALLGSGTFYSTAAVMYGRVFLGNTDGRVYAYDASTGKLDWAVQTGAYVYASPAIANAPGLGPTLYVGSYDGHFYALNARSGHVDWKYDAGGRISGSATVVGRVVYFADLASHRTYGLGISTGRLLFQKHTGAFDPVISDGRYIYLTGYTGLYALAPTDEHATPPPKARPSEKRPSTASGPRARAHT